MQISGSRLLFGITLIFLLGAAAQGATFTAAANGVWTNPATWTSNIPDSTGYPDTGDFVIISGSHTVTVSGAQNAVGISVEGGSTLTLNSGATLTVSGLADSFINNANAVTNGPGKLRTRGTYNINNSGTFSAPVEIADGALFVRGSIGGTVTVLSGTTLTVSGNQTATFNGDITINAGGTVSSSTGTFNINSSLVNNGTIDVAGAVNFGGAHNFSGTGVFTGNFTVQSGGTRTLTSNVAFGDGTTATALTVATGGTLAVGSRTLTLNQVTAASTGAVTGTGKILTQDTTSVAFTGTFTAPLEIGSGTTTFLNSSIGGSLTILNGAALAGSNQTVTFSGDTLINAGGTLSNTSGTFNFGGANIVNNGTIAVPGALNFNRSGVQNLSGTGSFTGDLGVQANSVTTLTGGVTIGNGAAATSLTVAANGTLSVGNNTLILNRVTATSTGTVTAAGTGKARLQGTSAIALNSAFTAPLEIGSGTTSASGSVIGSTVSILSSATLNVNNQTVTVNGDLNIGGTLTSATSNGIFIAKGASIINNGSVTGTDFRFGGTTQTLSGTGSISSAALILSGAAVSLGSNHQFSTLAGNAGGAFSTATFTAFLNGAGTPLSNLGTPINGSFTYNGTAAQIVQGANVDYIRLGINNAAGATLSATKIISQQLLLINGTLDSSSNLMLADDALIQRERGALANPPTFVGRINVEYVGASTPLGTGPELPVINTILKDLTVNKSIGTIINLNSPATVNGALTLTSGYIVPGANVLTVSDSGTATGTENSYVLGSLTKQYEQLQLFTYPVGTANGYSPLNAGVSSVAVVPSSLAAGVVQTVQPNVPAGEQTAALKRYWTLSESGNLAATLTFNYRQVDVPAGFAESGLRLRRYTGGTGVNVPSTVDPNGNTITISGPVADFSDWTAVALGPTAAEASLGGQVVTAGNRGLANVTVTLTDLSGQILTVKTNSFGYFQFSDLKAGETYILNARHKQYSFNPQAVNLTADLSDLIIAAQ